VAAKRGIAIRGETKEDNVPKEAHVENRENMFPRKCMSKNLPIVDNVAP
jgi:hypothetical protein